MRVALQLSSEGQEGPALDVHPCYDSKLCKGDADRTEEERRAHKQSTSCVCVTERGLARSYTGSQA